MSYSSKGLKIGLIFLLFSILQSNYMVDACCDIIVPMSNFSWSQFAGQWFVYQVDRKQEQKNCFTNNFVLSSDMDEYMLYQYYKLANGTKVNTKQNLTLNEDDLSFWTNEDLRRMTVIATDYTSYAVVADCFNKYGSNVMVLTRNLGVNRDISALIYLATEKINFNTNYLTNTQFGAATCNANGSQKNLHLVFLLNSIALFIFKKFN